MKTVRANSLENIIHDVNSKCSSLKNAAALLRKVPPKDERELLSLMAYFILGLTPGLILQLAPTAYLGGILGAAFQLLMVITLRRHGDLVANTLIQTMQVLFGYLTAFYR